VRFVVYLRRVIPALALIGATLVLAHSVSTHWLSTLIALVMWSCNAVAWNIASGYTGIFSLGHHVFFGVGAYTSTMLFLRAGVSPWIGMFLGGLLAALLGAAVGGVTFRYQIRGVFLGLTTLALGEVARSVAAGWNWIGGPVGLLLPMSNDPKNFIFIERLPYFYIAFAMLLTYLGIAWLIERSWFGYYLKAIREDEGAAEASGVNTYLYKTVALGISAGLTGMVGTFYAQYMLFIAPDVVFHFDVTLNMLLGVMVGGSGTLFGPVLGSSLFTALGEGLRNLPLAASARVAAGSKMVYAAILVITALYMPGGIVGWWQSRRSTRTPAREARPHAA